MARQPRFKISTADTWYHLYARVAGSKGVYPLAETTARRTLMSLIQKYGGVYFCQVAAVCIMGNHYHLVVRFQAPRQVPKQELKARAYAMYPGEANRAWLDQWSQEQWERYQKRLFDVSEFMRNLQSAFARWYNRTHHRCGRFWADRFKSTVLGDDAAVLNCILYVELNPVRAGIVERPETYPGSSIFLREVGEASWLMPLRHLLGEGPQTHLLREFRERLYYRGAVPTKEGQAAIRPHVLAAEEARGFATRGMYRKRWRFFTEGVAVGTEAFILEQLARMRDTAVYRKRKRPIPQLGGTLFSLREQRSHAIHV